MTVVTVSIFVTEMGPCTIRREPPLLWDFQLTPETSVGQDINLSGDRKGQVV